MNRGGIYIYTGVDGEKTSAAWGRAVETAAEGKKVIIICFSQEKEWEDNAFIRKLEPEIRLFHFGESYGLGYAKKVLSVSECELLILDGVLELAEGKSGTAEDIKQLLENRHETDVILTGSSWNAEICNLADKVFCFETADSREEGKQIKGELKL